MSSAARIRPAVVDAGNPTEPRQQRAALAMAMLGFAVADPQVRTWLRRVNLLR